MMSCLMTRNVSSEVRNTCALTALTCPGCPHRNMSPSSKGTRMPFVLPDWRPAKIVAHCAAQRFTSRLKVTSRAKHCQGSRLRSTLAHNSISAGAHVVVRGGHAKYAGRIDVRSSGEGATNSRQRCPGLRCSARAQVGDRSTELPRQRRQRATVRFKVERERHG